MCRCSMREESSGYGLTSRLKAKIRLCWISLSSFVWLMPRSCRNACITICKAAATRHPLSPVLDPGTATPSQLSCRRCNHHQSLLQLLGEGLPVMEAAPKAGKLLRSEASRIHFQPTVLHIARALHVAAPQHLRNSSGCVVNHLT